MYLFINISGVILTNIILSVTAKKMFPTIFNYSKADVLDSNIKNDIFKNVKALLYYKVGGVLINGTDNIIISSFVGLISVGIYSNYYMLVAAIRSLLIAAINSLTASVGNLYYMNKEDRAENIYYLINHLSFLCFGIISVCFFSCASIFIDMWIGSEYIINDAAVLAISLNLFMYGMKNVSIMYRNTIGIFRQGRFRPIIGVIINIILSIFWAQKWGVAGVLFATTISDLLTVVWFDPLLILRIGFHQSLTHYLFLYFKYLATILICFGIVHLLHMILNLSGLLGFMIYGIIAAILFISISILFFRKSKEQNEFINLFLNSMRTLRIRISKNLK